MKIRIYLTSWRTRHGDSGIDTHYSHAERVGHLASWLADSDGKDGKADIDKLIEAGELDEAIARMANVGQSSGHEWEFYEAEIETTKAERVDESTTANFRNSYRCSVCSEEWSNEDESACNDRCPKCRAETEPRHSEAVS